MKRKLFTWLAVAMLLATFPQSVSASELFTYSYAFESGAGTLGDFGTATPFTSAVAIDHEQENVRRNKDVTFYPPSYGVFGGDIPTERTSLFHAADQPEYARVVSGDYAEVTTADQPIGGTVTSYYSSEQYLLTALTYYADGSIGTLKIPRLKLTVRVFEGETLDSMQKGAGHFEFTSAWDGNVGIAGHNRGSAGYFEGVKDLRVGDEIIYTTKYGTRTYSVYAKDKIGDTDYSKLGWSGENILTLITCVEDVANQRWAVQARMK